jgi:hypothetical protein
MIDHQTSRPHLTVYAVHPEIIFAQFTIARVLKVEPGPISLYPPLLRVLRQVASVRASDGASEFVMGQKLICGKSVLGSVPFGYTI